MAKVLLTLDDSILKTLEAEAKKRGVNVQLLLRTVVIPDWIKKEGLNKYRKKKRNYNGGFVKRKKPYKKTNNPNKKN